MNNLKVITDAADFLLLSLCITNYNEAQGN